MTDLNPPNPSHAQPSGKRQNKNIVVFYDSPCVDGACAAWAVKEGFKNEPDLRISYEPLVHGNPKARAKIIKDYAYDDTEMIFVDTSPSDETLDMLLKAENITRRVKKITIVDHHESEGKRIELYNQAYLAQGGADKPELEICNYPDYPSAAACAWQRFVGGRPPKLFNLVGEMEYPIHIEGESDIMKSVYVSLQDMSTPQIAFESIDKLIDMETRGTLLDEGKIAYTHYLADYRKLVTASTDAIFTLEGKNIPVRLFNKDLKMYAHIVEQDLLNAYQDTNGNCHFAMWQDIGGGQIKVSLRSRGKPTALAISQSIGDEVVASGGHSGSVGITFPDYETFRHYFKQTRHEKNIKPEGVVQANAPAGEMPLEDTKTTPKFLSEHLERPTLFSGKDQTKQGYD